MTPKEQTDARIRKICAEHKIKPDTVTWELRAAPHLAARREIARYLRYEKHWSLPRIGTMLNRHHTTVINMLRLSS